jgi:hypothetical protein
MEDPEIKNAIITCAELELSDNHEVLTGWLRLDYGVSGQGFGGYKLYFPKSSDHHKIESLAGHWIFRVLEIAGVSSWDELPGKTIRVKATFGEVIEIGHIVKDDWFNPGKDFAPVVKKEEE